MTKCQFLYWFAFFIGVAVGFLTSSILLNTEIRRKAGIAAELLKYHYEFCPKAPTYGEAERKKMREKAASIVAGRDGDF